MVTTSVLCTQILQKHGSREDGRGGQSMPKPSQPSLMATCSILCTSSYESYVGRHSWLKLEGQGDAVSSDRPRHWQGWKGDPHGSTQRAVGYLPRVCGWQRAMGRSGNNLERGTEGGKTSGRQLGGARRELKEAGKLLLRQTGNHGPKPPHDLAGRAQAGVAPGCHLGFGPEGKEPDSLQWGCAPVTIL